MNILLDIGHPAHVHLYRNLWKELSRRGHNITVTVRDLPSATTLLSLYEIPYITFGRRGNTITGKGLSQVLFNLRMLLLALNRDIDIGLGSSITTAHISRITPMRSIVFDDDDDEVQPLMTKYGHPFAHTVLSPDALSGRRRKKDTIYYAGYHELAYLHPNWFKPDPSVLEESGLKEDETFFIMRFNAFRAHHDVGMRGLSIKQKLRLVEILLPWGKVFITTENEIEPELAPFRLKIRADKAHSLIHYATMLIGDSQTMTSEAAVLGTPSLRCNSFAGRISYLNEQELKYKLTFGFNPERFEEMVSLLMKMLHQGNLKAEWQRRRTKMLSEKIDVTAFMVWFIENYPQSISIMKEDPQFQYCFR